MSEELPLVSVIVPIYNVEKYIRKCLDSLKGQTLKQIEVICIDDGSTDGSGKIVEEYLNEEGWPIFRVIHTENRGLSAARNRGIEESRADWIMFVDSDDWVESEFCSIPYKTAIDEKADLVIFGIDHCTNGKKRKENKQKILTGSIDEFIAQKYGSNAAWNKLYKKNLFRIIRYPIGRNFEEIATTYKLIHEAEKIIMLQEALYHYVSREGSITNTITKSNQRDQLVSVLERRMFLDRCGYPNEKLIRNWWELL